MKEQQFLDRNCSFCSYKSTEKKHLFLALYKTLSKELQKLSLKYQNHTFENESNGFKQLLRIIFGTQLSRLQSNCDHRDYYVYFVNKLKCTEQNLNFVSLQLAQKLAQRNYHVELISAQVKNVAETIAEGKIDIHQQSRGYSKKEKQDHNNQSMIKQEYQHSLPIDDLAEKKETKKEIQQTKTSLSEGSIGFLPIYNTEFTIVEPNQTVNNINNMGYYYQYPYFYTQQSL